jgi:stage II sporulation protein D
VRVRVIEHVASVVLSGQGLHIQDEPVQGAALTATVEQGEVRIAHLASRRPVQVHGSGGVAVDGKHFPGNLALIPRSDGRMDVVNVLPLEPYVERAAAGEVYGDWPEEVLKVQTVVARTYALHERARRDDASFDLEATVISQRYNGGAAPARVSRAAAATRGEYLAHQGAPILAAFHACAGGRTASSREVWGRALPYLNSVRSPDDNSPNYFWSFEISFKELAQVLEGVGLAVEGGRTVRVLERSASGRIAELSIGEARLSGRKLRELFGGRVIRSTLFEVRSDGETVRFLGSGSGHGVGLSQWGARELALRGKSYHEILAHYYPGTTLERLDRKSRRSSARP